MDAGESSGTRIVLVDDDAGLRRTLQIFLEDEGEFRVVACASADEALERLARDGGADLVLTDLAMPAKDGLQVLREVSGLYPGLPVVLMTAFPDALRLEEALALGARGLVLKPFEPDLLLETLRRARGGVPAGGR